MSLCTQDITWNLVLQIRCSVSNARNLDTNSLAALKGSIPTPVKVQEYYMY